MKLVRFTGVSLIEVLVAVLVLALGVTGAAGMHLKALRATHDAGLQSAALQLATELAERMRAHHTQTMINGAARDPFVGLDYSVDAAATAPRRLCYADSCDPQELAEFDLYETRLRLQSSLPGGRIVVCRDAHPWDEEQGGFKWECDDDGMASVLVKVGWQQRDAAAQGNSVRPALALAVHP